MNYITVQLMIKEANEYPVTGTYGMADTPHPMQDVGLTKWPAVSSGLKRIPSDNPSATKHSRNILQRAGTAANKAVISASNGLAHGMAALKTWHDGPTDRYNWKSPSQKVPKIVDDKPDYIRKGLGAYGQVVEKLRAWHDGPGKPEAK